MRTNKKLALDKEAGGAGEEITMCSDETRETSEERPMSSPNGRIIAGEKRKLDSRWGKGEEILRFIGEAEKAAGRKK